MYCTVAAATTVTAVTAIAATYFNIPLIYCTVTKLRALLPRPAMLCFLGGFVGLGLGLKVGMGLEVWVGYNYSYNY